MNKRYRLISIFILIILVVGFLYLASLSTNNNNSISFSNAASGDVICGNADTNNNGVLDSVDYNELKQLVGVTCSDKPSQTYCGPKDMNGDGKIDIQDLSEFGNRYNKPNCGL